MHFSRRDYAQYLSTQDAVLTMVTKIYEIDLQQNQQVQLLPWFVPSPHCIFYYYSPGIVKFTFCGWLVAGRSHVALYSSLISPSITTHAPSFVPFCIIIIIIIFSFVLLLKQLFDCESLNCWSKLSGNRWPPWDQKCEFFPSPFQLKPDKNRRNGRKVLEKFEQLNLVLVGFVKVRIELHNLPLQSLQFSCQFSPSLTNVIRFKPRSCFGLCSIRKETKNVYCTFNPISLPPLVFDLIPPFLLDTLLLTCYIIYSPSLR